MNTFNRADKTGLTANIVVPVAATLALNALIFSMGWQQNSQALRSLWYAPPGWFIGAVWVFLYALYGVARWSAVATSEAGSRKSWWVVALIVWGLCYPFLSSQFDLHYGAVMNVLSLLLSLIAVWQIWPVSRRAVFWLIPSVVWESFAVFLGFAALSNLLA